MRLWLKVQARIWPVTCLESLHPPLLGSKRAVVNAHQEMFWGWSILTEIKVESTDVKQAIGVAISQWLHSSMCFVSEGNNSHKNMYSETCIKQKFWGDQMAWLYRWNYMKVPFQLTFQRIPFGNSFWEFLRCSCAWGRVHQTWHSNRWYKEYLQPLVLIICSLPVKFKTEDEEEVWISFCDS